MYLGMRLDHFARLHAIIVIHARAAVECLSYVRISHGLGIYVCAHVCMVSGCIATCLPSFPACKNASARFSIFISIFSFLSSRPLRRQASPALPAGARRTPHPQHQQAPQPSQTETPMTEKPRPNESKSDGEAVAKGGREGTPRPIGGYADVGFLGTRRGFNISKTYTVPEEAPTGLPPDEEQDYPMLLYQFMHAQVKQNEERKNYVKKHKNTGNGTNKKSGKQTKKVKNWTSTIKSCKNGDIFKIRTYNYFPRLLFFFFRICYPGQPLPEFFSFQRHSSQSVLV